MSRHDASAWCCRAGRVCALHHGRFQLDERALGVGIQVLTATLLEWMEAQSA